MEYSFLYNQTTGNLDEIDVDVINISDTLFTNNIDAFSGSTITINSNVSVTNDIDVTGTISGTNYLGLVSGLDLSSLTQSEIDQIANINLILISPTQWKYLSALDQNLTTISDVTFNNVTSNLTGNVTGNVTGNLSGDVSTDSIDDISGIGINMNNTNLYSLGTLNGFHLDRFLRNSTSSSVISRIPYFNSINNQIDSDEQLTFNSGVLSTDSLNALSSVASPIVSVSNEIQTNNINAFSGSDIDFSAKNIIDVANLTVTNKTTSEIIEAGVLLQTSSINTGNPAVFTDITFNNRNLTNVGNINGIDINTRGDMSGPSSSVDSTLLAFDGTTGKLVKSASNFAISVGGDIVSSVGDISTGGIITGNSVQSSGNMTCGNILEVSNEIKVDTIIEETPGSGVSIDGVLLKDGSVNFGQDNLNYYDEYSQTFTLTGVSGSSTTKVKFIRIGKLVCVQWDAWSFIGLGSAAATSNGTFPSQFDSPVGNLQFFVRVVVDGTSRTGFFRINTDQTFTIYSDVLTGGGVWPSLKSCSVNAGSCSYTLL